MGRAGAKASLEYKRLIYSTADEQVGELKQINYDYQSSVGLRWVILY